MIKNCKNCNNEFKTYRRSKMFCSPKCYIEYRTRPDIKMAIVAKQKATFIKNYGVEHPLQLKEIQEKSKKTCLEKYGVEYIGQSNDIKEKIKQTNIIRYGVENPFQNQHIQDKQHKTNIERYGVEYASQNKKIGQKITQTTIERYGVTRPLKSPKFKQKFKQTCLNRYSVDNPAKNKEVQNRLSKTILDKQYYDIILKSDKFMNVEPLFSREEYKGHSNGFFKLILYKWKCKICNYQFESSAIAPRCFSCYPKRGSKLQNELYEYIKSLIGDKTIKYNDKTQIYPDELDIYIPELKLAIEFNGLYWHSELSGKKYKNYHLNKTKKCEELGIRLIHVFEDEWLFKANIVKSKIKHILHINNNNKIYARKCVIKEISYNKSEEFLNDNHLQESNKSSIQLGAFYNNELVSVMTFGKIRYENKNISGYEIYRFCNKINTNVIGIFSKLFKYFVINYKPSKIISYVDRRWTLEFPLCYKKNDFKFLKETTPNYYYLEKNSSNRINRQNYTKHLLYKKLEKFDSSLTEWENMKLNGFDRIWNCGCLKYEWNASS